VRQELLGDQEFVIAPRAFDDRASLRLHERFVACEELLDLHRVVRQCLGGRIDRRQPAADDDDGQAYLHVRDRIGFRRAGELQRHQEIGRRAHAMRKSVRQVEHRGPPRTRGQGHVIETEREGAFGVDGAAEANATEERVARTPLEQQPDHLEEVLVPAHGDAVLGDAAEARHHAIVERLLQRRHVAHRRERNAPAAERGAGQRRIERLDLETVDGRNRMTVVQQVVGQREACRALSDDEHALAAGRQRHGPAQVERIPSRQQRIDLEAVRQGEHVLQHARFRLRNVDRILFLVDARLHAVVADPVTGGGRHRVVDADHRQRADRPAFGAQLVEFGDALLERAAGERHPEDRLLERVCRRRGIGGCAVGRSRALFEQPARARVLALFVAPDAVVRLIERTDEIGSAIGQRESVATPESVRSCDLQRLDVVVDLDRFGGHELVQVELARRTKQHAAAVRGPACCRMRCPGRVALRDIDPLGIGGFVLQPLRDRPRKRELERLDAFSRADRSVDCGTQRGAVERRRDIGLVGIHRLALHELSLDGVERRQRVVLRLERLDVGDDAEQAGEKVLDVRRDVDQQRGFFLRR
jgi:hypothetical protein